LRAAAKRALPTLAALLIAVFAGNGCAPATRYHVLSFFFDGVPPPEETGTTAAAGAGVKATPSSKKIVVSKHAPYEKKQCVGCHSYMTNTLTAPIPELCFGCHKMGQQEKRYIHAPAVSGLCRTCHEPHSSPNPFLLLKPPRQMCLYCHNAEDVAKNKGHTDDQAPCTKCHDVHADIRFFLRSDSAGTPPPAKGEPASAQ
jgi:predicted CXXCH cytochrome family protein